jgi:hypothetical protein
MMYDEYEQACGYADLHRDERLTFDQVHRICDSHGLDVAEFMLDTAKVKKSQGGNSLTLWFNSMNRIIENGGTDSICTAGFLSDWLGY